jgi:AraC-like DNA-binding protein
MRVLLDLDGCIVWRMLRPLLPEILAAQAAERSHPHDTGWRSLPWAIAQVVEGGRYRLRRSTGREVVLRGRGGWFIPAGIMHRIDAPQPGAAVRATWAHLRCPIQGGDALAGLALPTPLPTRVLEAIAPPLAALAAPAEDSPLARSRFAGAAASLLAALLAAAPPVRERVLPQRIADVVAAVEAEPAARWTRAALARRASLSEPAFHVAFAAALGESPMRWLRRRRLSLAQELLHSTDLAIAEIAARVGYPDPFHFSRAFAAWSRCPPRAWRARSLAGG